MGQASRLPRAGNGTHGNCRSRTRPRFMLLRPRCRSCPAAALRARRLRPAAFAAEPASAAATSAAPLRWKSKPVGSSQVIADSSPALTIRCRSRLEPDADGRPGPPGRRPSPAIRSTIRLATALHQDRDAVRQASDIELEPTEAEGNRAGASAANGVEELPAPSPRPLRAADRPASNRSLRPRIHLPADARLRLARASCQPPANRATASTTTATAAASMPAARPSAISSSATAFATSRSTSRPASIRVSCSPTT